VIKSELATFFEAFPNGSIWSTGAGLGSDIVALGQYGGCQVNLNEMEQRLERAGYKRVAQSLREIGFPTALDLCAGYSGRALDLGPWLRDAEINHDQNLRLEYLAGFTLNDQLNNPIYRTLISYRRFPNGLFTGSPQVREALTKLMVPQPGIRERRVGG